MSLPSKKPILVRCWRGLWRRSGVSNANWVEKSTLIVAVFLLVVTWRQANIYERQAQLMQDSVNQTERSVILGMGQLAVANRNAKTAEDTLKDSRESFQIENRPYVMITTQNGTAGFPHKENVFDLSRVNITYGNTGLTPAYDVFMFTNFSIARFPKIPEKGSPRSLNAAIEDAFKPVLKDEGNITKYYSEIEKVDLAPKANAPFVTAELRNGPLTETDKIKLGETPNEVILISVGRIHYKAFDKVKSYSTDFCFYYFGTDPHVWHYCPIHNLVQ